MMQRIRRWAARYMKAIRRKGWRALGRATGESVRDNAVVLYRRVRWPGCRCEDVEWLDECWCRCKRCGALGLGERPRKGTR